MRAQACQRGADAKANTIGGGALEVEIISLLEDGSERGGALVSDAVVPDTTRDGWGHSERAGACQRALTRKQTLWGGGALEVGDLRLLEDGGECGGAFVSDVVQVRLRARGRGKQ